MSTIILSSNKPEDIKKLIELATQLNIQFFTIPKMNRQMKARQRLVEWASRNAPKTDISPDLIEQLVEQTRAERHENKQNPGGR